MTLVIISALLAISAPAIIGQVSHIRLKRAARDVAAELNAARFKAVSKNMKYRLAFTLYASTSTPDTFSVSYLQGATWTDEPSRPVREVQPGVDITSPGASFDVDFFPNGTGTATDICLQNLGDASDRLKVSVSGSTGRIEIAQGC